MKENNNFPQGRSIIAFDLGGTLVDESTPEFYDIPEHLINKFGLDAKTLSQILFLAFNALMKENDRQANEQISAKVIIKKVVEALPYDISMDSLEELQNRPRLGEFRRLHKPLTRLSKSLKV